HPPPPVSILFPYTTLFRSLIRRLDENTGPENFLRHAFRLTVDSPDWKQLERGFRDAFTIAISDAPRRTQDRARERFDAPRDEMRDRKSTRLNSSHQIISYA